MEARLTATLEEFVLRKRSLTHRACPSAYAIPLHPMYSVNGSFCSHCILKALAALQDISFLLCGLRLRDFFTLGMREASARPPAAGAILDFWARVEVEWSRVREGCS